MSSLNPNHQHNPTDQQDQLNQAGSVPVAAITNKRQHSNSYLENSTKRSVLDTSPSVKVNYDSYDNKQDRNITPFKTNYSIQNSLPIAPSPNQTLPLRKFATFNNPTFNLPEMSKNVDVSDRAIPSSTPPPSFLPQKINPQQQQQLVSNLSDTSSLPDTTIQQSQSQGFASNSSLQSQPQPQTQNQNQGQTQPPQQQSQQQQKLTDEEQALINKLQDSYKVIVGLENDIQKKCANLNLSMRLDMTELWDIYNLNVHLLNTYNDFLVYSLNSGRSGKQIVQIYRIQRRLWVYGIVTFLDVLKNVVSIFIEHDICSSFISFSFNILTGLTSNSIDSWIFEKIGDLSRMAIALYPSRYIDWKLSSEYWYQLSMKLNYGQGKIYYHVATVQQDNLDALMNIGKAVFSRETFVPTPQYMKMVIDNINQRQYVDQPVMDFIRLHKIILNDEAQMTELDRLIDLYILNLGKDSNNINFFQKNATVAPDVYDNKLQFWFQRSSSFALVNILQVCGFGNPEFPLARLFGLLDALKERKDRKDKKDKKKGISDGITSLSDNGQDDILNWSEDDWLNSLDRINVNALKLSRKMLQSFLQGPIEPALPHVITYLYFILAIGKSIESHPESEDALGLLVQLVLPLDSLIDYLNSLLSIAQDEFWNEFQYEDTFYDSESWIDHFNENETLYEVWKCWGTLWFDKISLKQEYDDYRSSGIFNNDFLDVPVSGVRYEPRLRNQRILRILLLASYISQNFPFGIKRDLKNFKVVHSVSKNPKHQEIFTKFTNLGIIEEVTPLNILTTQPTTIPISQWLKQSSNPTNVPDSPTSPSSNLYYFDNDGDYENSTTSTPSIPASVHHNNLTSSIALQTQEVNSKALFVLDTNMWLKHCGKLYKSLRSKIFKLGIPLVVFQELRSLRCSQDATVSDTATRAVITLRQLTSEGLVFPMRMNGDIISNINDIKDFENNNGWMEGIDDIIIRSIALKSDGLLITEDKNMRLKAKMKNLNAYNGSWFWEFIKTLSEGKCND